MQNIATHYDLSVERKDKVYISKLLRYLSVDRIHDWRLLILHQVSVKRLLEKVEMKQEPITAFDTQKVDVNHGFLDVILRCNVNNLNSKQHQKMNLIICPKNFELWKRRY